MSTDPKYKQGLNGNHGLGTQELYSDSKAVEVDFKRFYGLEPRHVDRRFTVKLSDLSYLPKIDNPTADWVVTAALNAFIAFEAAQYSEVRKFATVGTGSGTDAIAALEIFPRLSKIAMTDLHDEVVKIARLNLLSAVEKADDKIRDVALGAVARSGDILAPLRDQGSFDLIYENLPNIPLPEQGDLFSGQTSATYVGSRNGDSIPSFVSAALLDLHYVCLCQAKTFGLLKPCSAVLSSMGGRISIGTALQLADAAGYIGRILVMSWKVQSEPMSVIGGYAAQQEMGLGPFHFYRTEALKRVFRGRTAAGAGLCAIQIESELLGDRLDAVTALEEHKEGIEIGHTVLVMASVLKDCHLGEK